MILKNPKLPCSIFFTNALEAIKIRQLDEPNLIGEINIEIKAKNLIDTPPEFDSLTITDNGIGFNNFEFKRFNTFKDFTKGYKNLGSGRIQYAHFFDNTIVNSVYKNNGSCYERDFVISKKESFLRHNAMVLHRYVKPIDKKLYAPMSEYELLALYFSEKQKHWCWGYDLFSFLKKALSLLVYY